MEDEAWAAGLEPGVVAAVHLDEEAGLGHALAAAAMPRGAAGAGTTDPGLAEEQPDQRPREVQAFPLREQLGEMMVIDPGIRGARQGKDLGSDGLREAPRGGAAPVAMSQRGEAMLADLGQEPADVPDRQGQELSRHPSGEGSGLDPGQDMGALLLLLGQGNRLPGHTARVTDSRSQ